MRLRTSRLLCGVAICAITINTIAPIAGAAAAAQSGSNAGNTTTPIKHVIVIIGENRTFDHLFATYQPVNKGETVLNLLSEGIVNADGTPGPNYSSTTQYQALDTTVYQSSPPKTGRVGMWRGGVRSTMSVAAPFVWRCLSGSAITPFPHPA